MTAKHSVVAMVFACLLLLMCSIAVSAQNQRFSIRVPFVSEGPKVDGTLDDPIWKRASRISLDWDFTFRRPAEEPTEAFVLADSRFLYVGIEATQTEPLVATQHTNDVPLSTDDVVDVYLWPGGKAGFEYTFSVNPIGTHYAASSENTSFAPRWESVGHRTDHGYVLTERIPLDVLRGEGRDTWLLQVDRTVRSANLVYEWAHDSAQRATDSSIYVGDLTAMGFAAKRTRVKPRVQPYVLGQVANGAAGSSTSRIGADFAIPITQTASFVGTVHPDYSNVELDQQTISPTVFPRQLQEVRPFFTQGSQFYNELECHGCVNTPLLYTPAIPTPRDGYAVEGVQGRFRFGAFDAVADGRSDTAQAVQWESPDKRFYLIGQRQSADLAGTHDVASYFQAIAGNVHNFDAYITEGNESGTGVTLPGAGVYREYGVNLFTPKSGLRVAYHDVGSQYGPVDSYVAFNDVKGPTVGAYREFDTSPTAFIQSVTVSQDFQQFKSHAGLRDYTLDQSSLTFTSRTNLALSITTGENYFQQAGGPGGFANQYGVGLTYKGNTSTPSSVSYNTGRYGAGYLRSWQRLAAFQLGHRGTLSLEADNTTDFLDTGDRLGQWLERASLAYQLGPSSSLAIGARSIKGTAPAFFNTPAYVDGTNISLAFYKRFAKSELYVAYGDPNVLATSHALVIKIIEYIGGQKGT